MQANRSRRNWCAGAARGALALAWFGPALSGLAQSNPRVIAIGAKKFEFTPDEITLKRGEPVILELTASDVTMGFKAVDFGLRTDIPPGMPVRLHLTPEKPGKFTFFCDVFCGDDHELMTGIITVTG
jgi:cytochrome c oxidase subunit II